MADVDAAQMHFAFRSFAFQSLLITVFSVIMVSNRNTSQHKQTEKSSSNVLFFFREHLIGSTCSYRNIQAMRSGKKGFTSTKPKDMGRRWKFYCQLAMGWSRFKEAVA